MSATAKRAERGRQSRFEGSRGTQSATIASHAKRRYDALDEGARVVASQSLGSKSENLTDVAMRRHDMSQQAVDGSSPRILRRSLATNSDTSSLKDIAHQASVVSNQGATDRTPQRRQARRTATDNVSSMGEDSKDAFIKVVVRIRPRIPKEVKEPEGCTPQIDDKSIIITDGRAEKIYAVDEVHDAREECNTQVNFFTQVAKPFTTHSLQGFNVCFFAYGHTGTGKTFTMLGDGAAHRNVNDSKAGILPRYIREIFSSHEQDPRGYTFRYTCEYYEVYNEKIRDLLAPVEERKKTTIHVHPLLGVKVDGVEPNQVDSATGALELVDFGNKMRTVASTTMNERSSRSHAIFTFKFQLQDGDRKTPLRTRELDPDNTKPGFESTMTFVDLAGREDQEASTNQNMQFREMCYINTSLFHLAHLITKLSQSKGEHDRGLADFRNSKLTLLLSQALIGNSRTLLIATLAPLQIFFEDSVSTLSFAQSVKRIQTKPVQNKKSQSSVVTELEAEVRALRSELKSAKTSSSDREQELMAAQHWISHYKRSWEDALLTTQELKKHRQRFSTLHGFHEFMSESATTEDQPGHVVPFFTKLCDDPALQGCCNYFLHHSRLLVGSNDNDCNIVLKGIGIHSHMCEVSYDINHGIVEVQAIAQRTSTPSHQADKRASPTHGYRQRLPTEHYTPEGERIPRILINGQPLTSDRPSQRMKHGDCIILGHSHAFRLVMITPSQVELAACADPSVLARSTVESLDMATALAETMDDTSSQFKEVCAYVQQLSMRSRESTVQTFLSDMHRICPLIDEANLITKDIWGASCFSFQLHVLTDCFNYEDDVPELVVCVMQNMAPIDRFRAAVNAIIQWRHKGHRRMSDMSQESDDSTPLAAFQASPAFQADDWSAMRAEAGSKRRDTVMAIGKFRHPLVHQMGLIDHMKVGKDTLLYVWALEKFLRRLKEMREIYQEGSDMEDDFSSTRDRLRQRPYLNPWREMNFADVKNLAEDYRQDMSPRNKAAGGSYSSDNASRTVSEVFSPIPESAAARTITTSGTGTEIIAEHAPLPKNKVQPYGAIILRFPDAPWPAPDGFPEELQGCLSGLGIVLHLDQLTIQIQEDNYASSTSLTKAAGVLVEIFGPDAEMEEFRKAPLFSRLVVLGYPVDGVQFKTAEAALRLEDKRWNAALQAPSPLHAATSSREAHHTEALASSSVLLSAHEVGLGAKPPSLAEAVRASTASSGRIGQQYMPAPDTNASQMDLPAVAIPEDDVAQRLLANIPIEENSTYMVSQIRELVTELKAVAIGGQIPSSDFELHDFAQKHIDELRAELATCREETSRMFSEQSRLSSLLGRFEGVLTRLSPQEAKSIKSETPSLVRSVSAEGVVKSPRGSVYRKSSRPPPSPRLVAIPQAVSPQIAASRRSLPSFVASPRVVPGPSRYAGAAERTRTPSPGRSPRSQSPRGSYVSLPNTSLPYVSRMDQAQLSRTAWEQLKPSVTSLSSPPPPPPAQRILNSALDSTFASTIPPSSFTVTQGNAFRSPVTTVALGSGSAPLVQTPILASPRPLNTAEVVSCSGSVTFSVPQVSTTPRRPPSPAILNAPTELIATMPPEYDMQIADKVPLAVPVPLSNGSKGRRRDSLFSKIDTNRDGIITRDELNSAMQAGVISETGPIASPSLSAVASSPPQVGQRSPLLMMPGAIARTGSPIMPADSRVVQPMSEGFRVKSSRTAASASSLPAVTKNGYLPAPDIKGAGSLPLASKRAVVRA